VCLNGVALLANATSKLSVVGLLMVLPVLPVSAQSIGKIRACVNFNDYPSASDFTTDEPASEH
jgi:hypothetical protein